MSIVLRKLEEDFEFEFRVISDREPDLKLRSLNFVHWNKATEINDLSKINIGIMPLKDDQWANGKCGFKALQYMALGMPALVSPVGVNQNIVDHEVNGFLCSNNNDWYKALKRLFRDRELLEEIGIAARKKVEECYSVASNTTNFLLLFD